jgi:BirA family biotin operon repressor/biotin-[acetyl-CoA-carboxylase] ligase
MGATIVEGNFDSIDETGCMIVRTAAGKRIPISAGDVYFGSASTVRAS